MIATAAVLLPGLSPAQIRVDSNPITRLAPSVASPASVVERMLDLARLKPGETLYDLGSGDGRVLVTAAQHFGAKAVGIESSAAAVLSSREHIRKLKLDHQIQVIEGDLLRADLSDADVVTIYLLTASNDLLRPNLEKYLKAGARVVSHDYPIRGWVPARTERVNALRREHILYVYEMPPKAQ